MQHDHIGLAGDQPVQPVCIYVTFDHVFGQGLVVGIKGSDGILMHVLHDDKHALDGIVERHLSGVEQVFYGDKRLGLLDNFLANGHLGEIPHH